MRRNIKSYSTLIFDCDGVVLNSNGLKTKAFFETVVSFGPDAAEELVEYHKRHGGVSRFKKFDYFLTKIVETPGDLSKLDELVNNYADMVRQGLRESQVEPHLKAVKDACPGSKWLIVSGGAQDELREVFHGKGLAGLFDGGIFGSPDLKEDILAREIDCGNIVKPALFIGDSKYDYLAAKKNDIDFVFVKQWTEFADWPEFCRVNNIVVCEGLSDILRKSFE